MPDYVRDVGGRMIKGRHPDTRIMSSCKKCIAGAQACAQNAKAVVPLLIKPIQAATYVDDGLAAGVECTADVRGHSVVGTMCVGRHPNIVVWHAQSKHSDAQEIQHPAETGIRQRIRVPMR